MDASRKLAISFITMSNPSIFQPWRTLSHVSSLTECGGFVVLQGSYLHAAHANSILPAQCRIIDGIGLSACHHDMRMPMLAFYFTPTCPLSTITRVL